MSVKYILQDVTSDFALLGNSRYQKSVDLIYTVAEAGNCIYVWVEIHVFPASFTRKLEGELL
jgi:hypothetical protein